MTNCCQERDVEEKEDEQRGQTGIKRFTRSGIVTKRKMSFISRVRQ